MIFLIFPLFFVSTFGYEKTVECEVYNQRYPNLTLTKIYSEKTNTTCEDICIQYLCPVNYFDERNNEKVYVMGSGCREDVRKNCEFYIDFEISPTCFRNSYVFACMTINENGTQKYIKSLKNWIEITKSVVPTFKFGWNEHALDIQYQTDKDGIISFNESLNTIYPITESSSTSPKPDTTTTTTLPPSTTTLINGGQNFCLLPVVLLVLVFAL